jgi:hypothetical protein
MMFIRGTALDPDVSAVPMSYNPHACRGLCPRVVIGGDRKL